MGELFKQLSNDLSTLVRQELELARVETKETGKKAGLAIGMFGGASIAGLVAFLTFTTCIVAALATGMKVWLAALIVTVVYVARKTRLDSPSAPPQSGSWPACSSRARGSRTSVLVRFQTT